MQTPLCQYNKLPSEGRSYELASIPDAVIVSEFALGATQVHSKEIDVPPPPPRKVRLSTIDFVRGMAILTMLQANVAPYVDQLEHTHISLRLLYSMAAPTFVFLSGYSACAFSKTPDTTSKVSCSTFFGFSVQRVWFAAVYVDIVAWQVYPVHSFDVLYVIGFGILTHGIFMRIDIKYQHVAYVLWSIASLAVYYEAPYYFEIDDPSLVDVPVPKAKTFFYRSVLQLFVSGYFPWFPWLLIAWSGGYFARFKLLRAQDAPLWFSAVTVVVFVITLVLYLVNDGAVNGRKVNPSRGGYQEIFYPVTLHFFFFCQSCTVLLIWVVDWIERKAQKHQRSIPHMFPVVVLGRNSLFVYIWHSMFVPYFFTLTTVTTNKAGAYFLLVSVMLFSCYVREHFIKDVKKLPTIARFITGL